MAAAGAVGSEEGCRGVLAESVNLANLSDTWGRALNRSRGADREVVRDSHEGGSGDVAYYG